MEKAYLSTEIVFEMEVNEEVTEEQLEHNLHEVIDIKGKLEVMLANGSVIYITAKELGNVVKCLGII